MSPLNSVRFEDPCFLDPWSTRVLFSVRLIEIMGLQGDRIPALYWPDGNANAMRSDLPLDGCPRVGLVSEVGAGAYGPFEVLAETRMVPGDPVEGITQ